jgi:plasmid stabilization system protein ParE
MYKIRYLPLALDDLKDIVRYISYEPESPQAAERLLAKIDREVKKIADNPFRCHLYNSTEKLKYELGKGSSNYTNENEFNHRVTRRKKNTCLVVSKSTPLDKFGISYRACTYRQSVLLTLFYKIGIIYLKGLYGKIPIGCLIL